MLLAVNTVGFFKAKKLPINRDAVESTNIAYPQRSLVGPWAHWIEVEIHGRYGRCGVLGECHALRLDLSGMKRPSRFEHTRFLGDKRTQLVYDLDEWTDEEIVNEISESGVGLSFGPDTLAEARNRGYTLAKPGVTRRHLKPRA
jgi:hypothetical protein